MIEEESLAQDPRARKRLSARLLARLSGSRGRLRFPDTIPFLRWGSTLLIVSAAGILPAALAILRGGNPGVLTRIGRHLYAGAFATAAVSLILAAIAAVPLRRGEKWAFWVYGGSIVLLGLPVVTMDTLYSPRETLLVTLAPQIAELALVAVGLALCGMEIFGRK